MTQRELGKVTEAQRNLADIHEGAEKTIILVCNQQRHMGIGMLINVFYTFFLIDIETGGLNL